MKLDREILAEIASVFQEFVDNKDITIPNLEKDQALAEDPDNDGIHPTTIYGSDWDILMDGIAKVLEEFGIKVSEDMGHKDDDQDEENTIYATVSGGGVEFENIPKPLKVELRDYDCEGMDGTHKDQDGDDYLKTIWYSDGSVKHIDPPAEEFFEAEDE